MNKDGERFLHGNKQIPVWNSQSSCSKEEYDHRIKELIKCKNDPTYFAENYFYIINMDEGKKIIKLYDKQRDLLETFCDNNRIVVNASRQSGKCCLSDSKITVRNKKTGQIQELTIAEFKTLTE